MKKEFVRQMTLDEFEPCSPMRTLAKSTWITGAGRRRKVPRRGSDKVYELNAPFIGNAVVLPRRLSLLRPGGNDFREHELSLANLV